jgi:hypothetical protein
VATEATEPELLLHVGDLAYATGYAMPCDAMHAVGVPAVSAPLSAARA